MANGKPPEDKSNSSEAFMTEMTKFSQVMNTQGVLLSRGMNKLIDALESVDHIQREGLAIGIRSGDAMFAMQSSLQDHPGGMKDALESSLGLMQAGFIQHSKGMLGLVAQAKATGQDSMKIIAGFSKMASVMPLSTKSMGVLGDEMQDSTRKYGIKTTALMGVLEKHAATLGRYAALGGKPEDVIKAISDITREAGVMHGDTVGMLAEKLTFKEGAADLSKLLVQLGDSELAARAQSDGISKELLLDINKATLKNFDELVGNNTDNRFIKSMHAKALGFDLDQITSMRALEQGMVEGNDLAKMGYDTLSLTFDQSIASMIKEIASPMLTMLIPVVQFIGTSISKIKELTAEYVPILGDVFKGILRVVGVMMAIKSISLSMKAIQWMTMMRTGNLITAAIGGLLAIGMYAAEANAAAKSRHEDEERTKRLQKDHSLKGREDWKRYVTGGLVAASLTSQNQMLPQGSSQDVLLTRIETAIKKGNVDRMNQKNSGMIPLGKKGS